MSVFSQRWIIEKEPDISLTVSYTHLRAHETVLDLVCRLLLEKKKKTQDNMNLYYEITEHNTQQ